MEARALPLPDPRELVGPTRRFGPSGPVYQILEVGEELPDGDISLNIVVVESGEELERRYTRVLQDPPET
jgi:hypothetical protein